MGGTPASRWVLLIVLAVVIRPPSTKALTLDTPHEFQYERLNHIAWYCDPPNGYAPETEVGTGAERWCALPATYSTFLCAHGAILVPPRNRDSSAQPKVCKSTRRPTGATAPRCRRAGTIRPRSMSFAASDG